MSKRGNNEGSISKREDGRWMARITLPGGKRKYFYGDTRAEVAKKMAEATRDRDRGLPVVGERLTLGQHLDTWLETSVKPSVRPRTYEAYESHVRYHLKPALGKVALVKLTPQQVQTFLNDKIAGGLSPATALRVRATLRKALNQALKWGLVSRNVSTLIDAPKVKRPKVEPLAVDEARKLIEAIRGHRLEGLYTLALAIGLRQGEALGLRWSDVDLDGGKLTVRYSLQRIEGKLQLVDPKTDDSRRELPIPSVAVQSLREHRARQNRDRLAAGDRWIDNGLVFTTDIGKPLIGPNVTRGFHRLQRRAGLRDIKFHALRHSCATFLLAKGVDLKTVSKTLGHSQISLTADTYAHVLPSLKQDAADKMDDFLRGEAGAG